MPIGYENGVRMTFACVIFNPKFQETNTQGPSSRAKFPSPNGLKELPEGRHADTVVVKVDVVHDSEAGKVKAANNLAESLARSPDSVYTSTDHQ